MKIKLIITLMLAGLLAGCANHGRHVPRHHSYKTVEFGAIIAAEEVTIGGTRSGIGAYIGSAAAIHDSTSHSFLGFVLRGLAGAIVGGAIEEGVTRTQGVLYTIELENGPLIEVLSTNNELRVGECAQITHAGSRHTKVKPTDARNCNNLTSVT